MDKVRSEFEAWAITEGRFVCIPGKDASGSYVEPEAESAWQAWQAARQPERGEAVAYLCDGMRFKVAATSSTMPVVGIAGLPAALAGRWVALVAADDDYATLTAEVSRLTGELDAASARLHEVATLCATVEQERDNLTAELEEVREQRNRIAATMTGELEKETAHSKHLAGAVSRKIEELIAVENQCGYYRMQYGRAEQVRKEACEANVKAQADMLWAKDELAESREREERMREALRHGRGIVPGGLWTSIELCAPNESPVKPGEYEDQYRFGWNACRAEVLRNMAALAAEKGEK